ncbi:MAG TPA: hypothetical protein PLH43_04150 [Acetivibrio sp.]|nr:hypothetical protein [Acetivibrio sp.]HOM02002.1 hypothetical protein [Acetivibrio sp.]
MKKIIAFLLLSVLSVSLFLPSAQTKAAGLDEQFILINELMASNDCPTKS